MPTKKSTTKTVKKAVKKVASVARSKEAKEFMQLMADYEASNPERYARVKDRLEAKLKTL